MEIKFQSNGVVQFNDARIVYRNFSGVGNAYNREGDRNFAIVIPDDEAKDALLSEGWNVKIKAPREEGDTPFMYLPIKVAYNKNGRGINAYLQTGHNRNMLDQETISLLDNIEIERVDLDIRPYDWCVGGRTGRSAYLKAIYVVQKTDRFADMPLLDAGE